jgi:hypothetical protein
MSDRQRQQPNDNARPNHCSRVQKGELGACLYRLAFIPMEICPSMGTMPPGYHTLIGRSKSAFGPAGVNFFGPINFDGQRSTGRTQISSFSISDCSVDFRCSHKASEELRSGCKYGLSWAAYITHFNAAASVSRFLGQAQLLG